MISVTLTSLLSCCLLAGSSVALAQTTHSGLSPKIMPRAAAIAKWEDRGEDVGVVATATSLFTNPDASSAIVSALKLGEEVVLVPGDSTGGWLECVQLLTGHQGWIRSARLQIHYTQHRIVETDSFSDERDGIGAAPILAIDNKTSTTLYLHLSGMPEVSVPAQTMKHITLKSGIYSFNAASAGLMPRFGHYDFLTGDLISWDFTAKPLSLILPPRSIDPALVSESAQLQKDLDTGVPALKIQAQKISDDETAFNQAQAKWKSDSDAVAAARATLDQTNAASVEAFNQQVTATNAELANVRSLQQDYNNEIANYNAESDKLNTEHDRLLQIQQTIDTP